MTGRMRFRVPKDESVPPVGAPVSVSVEGGSEWFELGVIESGEWTAEDGVTLVLALDPRLLVLSEPESWAGQRGVPRGRWQWVEDR